MGCGGGHSHVPFPYPYERRPEPEVSRQSSKDILKMRLARGEISLDEYREMIGVLQGDVSSPTRARQSHIRMP